MSRFKVHIRERANTTWLSRNLLGMAYWWDVTDTNPKPYRPDLFPSRGVRPFPCEVDSGFASSRDAADRKARRAISKYLANENMLADTYGVDA